MARLQIFGSTKLLVVVCVTFSVKEKVARVKSRIKIMF